MKLLIEFAIFLVPQLDEPVLAGAGKTSATRGRQRNERVDERIVRSQCRHAIAGLIVPYYDVAARVRSGQQDIHGWLRAERDNAPVVRAGGKQGAVGVVREQLCQRAHRTSVTFEGERRSSVLEIEQADARIRTG